MSKIVRVDRDEGCYVVLVAVVVASCTKAGDPNLKGSARSNEVCIGLPTSSQEAACDVVIHRWQLVPKCVRQTGRHIDPSADWVQLRLRNDSAQCSCRPAKSLFSALQRGDTQTSSTGDEVVSDNGMCQNDMDNRDL